MTFSRRLVDYGVDLPIDLPFTRAQANAAGVSDIRLHRLVRLGVLRRPARGVYVASELPDSIELRCRALGLVLPEDAFVCDRTAAWLYTGNGSLGPNEHLSLPPISFFRPSLHRGHRGPLTASGERGIRDGDVRELHGIRVTTELRTALDLGRLQPTRDLRLWGMDNLVATGAFSHAELLSEVPRFKGQRGVVGLRAIAPLVRVGSQSFGESALRLRWHDAGLPEPQLQCPVELDDGTIFYLDLADEESRFAAEYDGEEWHSTDEQIAHDSGRRERMTTEKRWQIEVFTRFNVFGIRQDASARLRTAAFEARAGFGERMWVL